ncbi:hypothetical protein M2164_002540 [Streptomyces sp. SAI-208]|uniref:hypothetical protein n=1 Tax=Streptomyces sp. SAI-208 TaxID=2940550 RepID=UPI002477262C|nr:hypothetical protein [Streptomyces sp. SAI-208]MDH6606905.1 hypothetical protein [Streptomyces sp. SAI-208]
MTDHPGDLLPVGAHALSADPRLAAAVRDFGSTYGYDYFDDAAVARTLAEHRAALRRLGRGGLVWAGSLAAAVGIVWLVWAATRTPDNMAVAVAPPAAVLVLALAAFVQVNLQGRRGLRHPFLEGYRHVLAAALAHDAPVAFVPAWLTGRGGAQLDVAPLPSYAAPAGAPSTREGTAPVGPPPKPAEVEEYERIAEHGGWHDEAGWTLVVAGAVGVGLRRGRGPARGVRVGPPRRSGHPDLDRRPPPRQTAAGAVPRGPPVPRRADQVAGRRRTRARALPTTAQAAGHTALTRGTQTATAAPSPGAAVAVSASPVVSARPSRSGRGRNERGGPQTRPAPSPLPAQLSGRYPVWTS